MLSAPRKAARYLDIGSYPGHFQDFGVSGLGSGAVPCIVLLTPLFALLWPAVKR